MAVDQMVVALMAHLTKVTTCEINRRWTRCRHLLWQEQYIALTQIWTFEVLHCSTVLGIVDRKLYSIRCCCIECAGVVLHAQPKIWNELAIEQSWLTWFTVTMNNASKACMSKELSVKT